MKPRENLGILILLVILIIGGVFIFSRITARGAVTSDLVIAQYLRALKSNNAHMMLRLVQKDYDARGEVAGKLAQYGGKDLRNITVSTKDNGVSSAFLYVTITGIIDDGGKETRFEDHINVECPSERWYLAIGKYVGKNSVANIQPTTN